MLKKSGIVLFIKTNIFLYYNFMLFIDNAIIITIRDVPLNHIHL